MINLRIIVIISLGIILGVASNAQAVVTHLYFGYGKAMSPDSMPASWAKRPRPENISYDYQLHQESYTFSSGEYVYFLIGLATLISPAAFL